MNNLTILQKNNLKSTPQRQEIIKILQRRGHVNIDDLYAELKFFFPSISLSTVYKNINIMTEKGFLSEVKLSGQKNVYELVKEHHSHVVCTRCKKIIDIEVNVSEILGKVQDVSHYTLNESSLTFHGLCPQCRKA